jgi:hypothetical protein
VSTATNPPPRTPTTPSQGSSDDQHVHEQGADPEDVHGGNRCRPASAPREHGDTEDASATPTVRVPNPRRGDGRDGTVTRSQTPVRRTRGRRRSARSIGTGTGTRARSGAVPVPTPEEWAQEQLKNAPPRSRAWAREVAAVYCLEIPKED